MNTTNKENAITMYSWSKRCLRKGMNEPTIGYWRDNAELYQKLLSVEKTIVEKCQMVGLVEEIYFR